MIHDSPALFWDWMIGAYLFLGGISGGAYLTGAAADYLRQRSESGGVPGFDRTDTKSRAYGLTALGGMVVSFAAISLGGLLLLFHLGEPLNAIELWLFTNIESWMAIGVWVIILFVVAALAQLAWLGFGRDGGFGLDLGPIDEIVDRTRPATDTRLALHIVGGALAVTLIVYTALLLSAVAPVVPLWHPILLPLLFLTSGISMGISATALVPTLLLGVDDTGVHEFSLADDAVILGEIGVLAALLWYLAGAGGTATASYELLTQTFMLEFWGFVVVVGLVLPLLISGTLILLHRRGTHVDGLVERAAYGSKFGFVLIGGLFLRLSILYAALNVPIF